MLTGIDGGGAEIEGLALSDEAGRGEVGDGSVSVIEPIDRARPFVKGIADSHALRRLRRGPL